MGHKHHKRDCCCGYEKYECCSPSCCCGYNYGCNRGCGCSNFLGSCGCNRGCCNNGFGGNNWICYLALLALFCR
ncbi:hypothetical protein FDF74_10065 [Clostridium niameyense]|uniref:Uncharacterized protein n=1 Tax=Clostridium niameyense TaxID=1622073 RepID=A0A6M0RBC4_9CLOT|nr:hypothetical protein [Clostridium niameyense]NEZ47536.1 hypothetical protein [Clostridium niameyense]